MSHPGDGQRPAASRPRGTRRAFHLRLARGIIPTAAIFVRTEAAGGIVLLVALVMALAWANSPWSDGYFDLWHGHFSVRAGDLDLETTLGHVVNDGLMTLFFFVVGLEIKRELIEGELSQPRQAALPVAAALGGMAVPALIYAAFNATGEGAAGWGIPMATDIAMAVGVLALLGSRVPPGLKVFLLALAIVDDIGGIVVIAAFYTDDLSVPALTIAGGLLVALIVMRVAGLRGWALYGLAGLAFWVAVLSSGVHGTIAGVVLALLTSAGTREDPGRSPLDRLETALHPWTSFLVVPVFALANGGVEVTGDALEGALEGTIAPGIFLGLVLGKPLGITLAAATATWLGLASRPAAVSWRLIAGAGVLAGVGFTVSLFIAGLAFESGPHAGEARLGILAASLAAGVVGYTWLLVTGSTTISGAPSGDAARARET